MSDIEKVILHTRKLESLLRTQYHAEGKGLHQLISSCSDRLPRDVIKQLRFIATIRNKLMHEDGYRLENRRQFYQICKLCEKQLRPRSGRFIWRVAIFLVLCCTLLALGFYYWHWDQVLLHF